MQRRREQATCTGQTWRCVSHQGTRNTISLSLSLTLFSIEPILEKMNVIAGVRKRPLSSVLNSFSRSRSVPAASQVETNTLEPRTCTYLLLFIGIPIKGSPVLERILIENLVMKLQLYYFILIQPRPCQQLESPLRD